MRSSASRSCSSPAGTFSGPSTMPCYALQTLGMLCAWLSGVGWACALWRDVLLLECEGPLTAWLLSTDSRDAGWRMMAVATPSYRAAAIWSLRSQHWEGMSTGCTRSAGARIRRCAFARLDGIGAALRVGQRHSASCPHHRSTHCFTDMAHRAAYAASAAGSFEAYVSTWNPSRNVWYLLPNTLPM